jgi:hypothetical protein
MSTGRSMNFDDFMSAVRSARRAGRAQKALRLRRNKVAVVCSADQMRKNWMAISVSMLATLLSLLAALFVYNKFASTPYPVVKFNGTISLDVPNAGPDYQMTGYLWITKAPQGSLNIYVGFRPGNTYKPPNDLCIPFSLDLMGDARISSVSYSSGQVLRVLNQPKKKEEVIQTKACHSPPEEVDLKLYDPYSFLLIAKFRSSMEVDNGYAMSFRGPSFSSLGFSDPIMVIYLGPMPEETRVDAASVGFTGSSLSWKESAKGADINDFPYGPPWGTFVSIPREQEAQQALFWTGALLGLAAGLLVWTLQAAMERSS